MSSEEENIELLSHALLSEAQSEADQILADAREKAEAVRKRAEAEAKAVREEILARAKQEAERLRSQEISSAQLSVRTAMLDQREKLLEKVFETARNQLSTLQQWNNYDQIVLKLIKDALTQLAVPQATIRADDETLKFLSEEIVHNLAKEYKVKLKVGDPLSEGTGVLIETNQGRLQFDNTLENRLNRLQTILRAPVYHLLMGEQV